MDIHNTQVAHYAITLTDPTTGLPVPVPAGDTFTAVSTAPNSLSTTAVQLADGSWEVVAAPLVLESDAANGGGSIGFSVSDTAGDVVADLTGADLINILTVPVVEVIHLAVPTFTTQPAPTNPGP